MKLYSLLCLLMLKSYCFSQGRFDNVSIQLTQVKENLYLLEGAGGNIALLSGDQGNIMIDAQYAELSEKIIAAIRKVSDEPIKYLINTHHHGDHTGGNANMHQEGALIISHENVRNRLSKDQNIQAFNKIIEAKPSSFWPDITFTSNLSIHLNQQTLQLIHVDNAHTDGDSFVYFSSLNVLHMGDTFFNGRFPYIDLASGGTVNGYIDAVKAALMICDEETIIIPGHGELANKDDLKDFLFTIEEMVRRVDKALSEGLSFEAIQDLQLYEDFQSWGTGFISGDKFVNTIWTDRNR